VLETALIRLSALDEQLKDLVEMRYFGGISIGDVAVIICVRVPTVMGRWQSARAWLSVALSHPIAND